MASMSCLGVNVWYCWQWEEVRKGKKEERRDDENASSFLVCCS